MSSTSIKFKRGNKADLPQSAPSGTPLWCEDSHELYMGTGNGVTKASKSDVVNDTTNSLNLMGVLSNDMTNLKCDSQITMQGGILRALQFIGNLIGNATCDGVGNNIVDTYATKQSVTNISNSLPNYQLKSEKGQANGYAPLNASSIVTYDYLSTDIANKSLSNLNTAGEDKLNTSKMYMTGETSSDPTGYAQLLALKNNSKTKSIVDLPFPHDFTNVGTPTITSGIAEFPSDNDYVMTNCHLPLTKQNYKIRVQFIATDDCFVSSHHLVGTYEAGGTVFQAEYNGRFTMYNYVQNSSGGSQNVFMNTEQLSYQTGDIVTVEGGFDETKGFYIKATANGQTVEANDDRYNDYWYKIPESNIIIGAISKWAWNNCYFKGRVDLSEFRVYFDDELVYVPCLYIPCYKSKLGVKIVSSENAERVSVLYEYKGYSPYFTINTTNQTFTLPMGELYGMLDKKANAELIQPKPLGQIISSAFPITDKNAVICDGSIIEPTENYLDFVNKMRDFYNSNNETLYCWKAAGFLGDDNYIYSKSANLSSNSPLYNANGTQYTGSDWKLKSQSFNYVPVYVDPLMETETPANRYDSGNKVIHNPPDFMTTEIQWQALNQNNGECGKFVYDETNNTVRLPNVKIFRDNYSLGEYKYVIVSQLL